MSSCVIGQVTRQDLDHTIADQGNGTDNEKIDRNHQRCRRFAQSPQVHQHQNQDQQNGNVKIIRMKRWNR